jgi:hypothetical protein
MAEAGIISRLPIPLLSCPVRTVTSKFFECACVQRLIQYKNGVWCLRPRILEEPSRMPVGDLIVHVGVFRQGLR